MPKTYTQQELADFGLVISECVQSLLRISDAQDVVYVMLLTATSPPGQDRGSNHAVLANTSLQTATEIMELVCGNARRDNPNWPLTRSDENIVCDIPIGDDDGKD